MQVHRLQLQVDDVGEVIEGLNDPDAVETTQIFQEAYKNCILLSLRWQDRPLDHSRAHGLRKVHDAGERICNGGVDGDVHSQAGQALLIFVRRTVTGV
jgi:hypothetical protein